MIIKKTIDKKTNRSTNRPSLLKKISRSKVGLLESGPCLVEKSFKLMDS